MEQINVEFDCQMKTKEDLQKVERSLKQFDHLDNIKLNLDKNIITFSLNTDTKKSVVEIQNKIEQETGLTTVLKGFGNAISAVSEIHSDLSNVKNLNLSIEKNKPIIGVIRLTQLFNKKCFVDAFIDNLNDKQEPFTFTINEYGDLSGQNLENVGNSKIKLIDNLPAQETSTRFNRIVEDCDLSDCIGRSVVINNKNKQPLAAGIIARAAPVSGNTKRICLCSGKTIWSEREENSLNN